MPDNENLNGTDEDLKANPNLLTWQRSKNVGEKRMVDDAHHASFGRLGEVGII